MNTVLVLGNSHSVALKEAAPFPEGFVVHWLRTKEGQTTGDVDIADALALAEALEPRDCLVFMRLGVQHNILGLLNHDLPFSLVGTMGESGGAEMIPEGVMRAHLRECATSDRLLKRFAGQVRCRIVHVMPPPPKKDPIAAAMAERARLQALASAAGAEPPPAGFPGRVLAYVGRFPSGWRKRKARRKTSTFEYRGRRIADVGFSPAPLRLALWRLEKAELDAYLPTIGIVPLGPPPETLTEEGYLDPAFSAADATHANGAYGARLLAQLVAFAAEPGCEPTTPALAGS